jgi:aminoglycoside phosphotransferase family enzyme/predicted kinase
MQTIDTTVAASTSLKEDLLQPSAYVSLAQATSVTRIETHLSWVFLLEREVFKVKRPVSHGLLDFRTIEQRRAACDAEMRFNARLAPKVYLGVVPIRRGEDARARLGGSGPIVDWAVHMVRLPDTWRADHLLAAHALDAREVDAMAARLATFHAAATSDATTARIDPAEAIAVDLEQSFAQTRDSLGRYLRAEERDEIVRWQTTFLRAHPELFARRIATGRVRDGHGDLRLEHVYFEPSGAVTILDCIELGERSRFADVGDDLALLSMDLTGHGRADLAERLLARYARETNDFELYAVVDFYQSYRAFVRGSVAALLARDDGADELTRRRADAEARRCFLLALSTARRPMLLPALVAVGGLIASGKTTVAERIGEAMVAPVIDAERTHRSMLRAEPMRSLRELARGSTYDATSAEEVHAEMLRRAAVVLASGRPVVIDASLGSAALRQATRALASSYAGVPFRFVECRAEPAICRSRLVRRESERGVSEGRLAIFDDFAARYEAVNNEFPSWEHVVIDTTRPVEEIEASLRAALDTWPRDFTGQITGRLSPP